MSTLSIDNRYFQIEKRNYSDWRKAVYRELQQNFCDSRGCTRTDITIEEIENGTRLTISDNGEGMSRETLLNIFLVVGRTGKNDSAEFVGGNGVARNLICFSANKYTIKSHDYVITGCGANYEIEDSPTFTKGCTFILEVDEKNWDKHIKYVIDRSTISQKVFINGEEYKSNICRGRLVRELSFADIYVNKSAESKVLVRVNGAFMHEHYSSARAQVIIEIKPEISKLVLQANRDGLQWEQQKEMDSFLNELASETSSALKDKTKHFKKIVNKNSYFTSKRKAAKANKDNVREVSIEEFEQLASRLNHNSVAINNNNYNPIDEEVLTEKEECPIKNSMLILNESEDQKIVNLINAFYHPHSWKDSSTRYQLLKQWAAVCSIVCEEFSDMTGEEFNWAVGWNFCDFYGDRTLAKCLTENGVNYFLLNPINEENKIKYSVNNKDDYYSLITLASHEVCHVAEKFHNERFASLMTCLMMRVLKRAKDIFTLCKEVK
jgi:Histidine kinase-, DNA gyrase B-, and HSP90-like ATPase